ncbi:MAG: hypothetical protein QM744_10895 [Mesorhizobium sp.]
MRHLREVARHRFIAREWTPETQAAIRRMTLADVIKEANPALTVGKAAAFEDVPALWLAELLYIARHNAAFRLEMPQRERRLLDAALDAAGAPQGDGLAASLLRMVRNHVCKDDFRRIVFTRDWQVAVEGDGRNAA